MSFFPDESILIVQCSSLVHEGPLEDVLSTLHQFVSLPYSRQALCIAIPPNFHLKTLDLNTTPDMVLTMTSMHGPKVIWIPFLIECAFSQGEKVFDQVKKEIATHPELCLVIIILITEAPKYRSPQKGGETWKYFEALGPLELDEFVRICNPQLGEGQEFIVPVTAKGHHWCSIDQVDYYVWLREDPTIPWRVCHLSPCL